jgi:FAD/FMN-containing dehydrogenase
MLFVMSFIFQLPGTEAYLHNCVCWNHDAIGSPSALWVPKTVDDVKAFMVLYSANPLGAPHSLSISGGRHSHYGLKHDAFVIDMSSFNKLEVDEQAMVGRFGAGLKLKDVDAAMFAKNVATTFGTNPDTGLAGLTLGGGFGWLGRRHGLAIDNLISARVVLANGEEVVANREGEYKDLFWAMRGGGGNFGIVTEFEFKLYKRGPVIKGASVFLTRKFTDVPVVLAEWKVRTSCI